MDSIEKIRFIQFGILSPEDVLSLSKAQIYRPASKGGTDKDRTGTPYDERLGVLENHAKCLTCQKTNQECDGHFGHIVLPIPIYHKRFMEITLKLLQCVCPYCARSRITPQHAEWQGLTKVNKYKRLKVLAAKCNKIETGKNRKAKTCGWPDCQGTLPFFFECKDEIRQYYYDKSKSRVFSAAEALDILIRIDEETLTLLGFNEGLSPAPQFSDSRYFNDQDMFHVHQIKPKSFIITILLVIPPSARPFVVRDGEKCDDDITDLYNLIIKQCIKLNDDDKSVRRRRTDKNRETERQKASIELQSKVWTLMDNRNEKSKLSSGGRPHKSLEERLSGKEGHTQKNVAGKRSNFTARAVIDGGGIEISSDEAGVPRHIANELTKEVYVTEWNINYCYRLLEEGQVNRIESVDPKTGVVIHRRYQSGNTYNLVPGMKIHRKLRDGDGICLNRQPTLRDESMLTLKSKIVDGFVIKLPLNVTPSYNADFDGGLQV